MNTTAPDDSFQVYSQATTEASESTPVTNPTFPVWALAPLVTDVGESHMPVSPTSPTSNPTALTASPMSEISEKEKMASGAPRSSCSRIYSSNLAAIPRSMPYNPFSGVSPVVHSGRLTKPKNTTNKASGSRPAHNRAVFRALRRQEIRRPHVGPEQRRRDELRASYHRLKNAVPTQGVGHVSRPRPTKIALLDRAATRINSLEESRQQLLTKIREVEVEAARLRQANEALALSVVGQHPTVVLTPP
ncbi:hypothetical protein EI94DRAFT_1712882 [Lactarius quietus]|nr:hypothetical protein EI94DRAFT_1712882 [Lactarius quietus]